MEVINAAVKNAKTASVETSASVAKTNVAANLADNALANPVAAKLDSGYQ